MASGKEEKKEEKGKDKTDGKEEKKEEKGKDKIEGKEEKKEEKGKDKIEGKEEKKTDNSEVITAIYRVNLHCKECGSKIKKHLMITQGVQNVDIDIEKGEIKVKGKLDPLKVLNLIEKKSKKKVELISPKIKPKESTPAEKKPKETKDPIIRTISVKVHMHCDKCEADLQNRLLKHKGIFSVKTDKKAQTVTVEGTIEVEKLISFLRKRVHKNVVVISVKEEKKEEKKETGKEEGKSPETTKDKDGGKSGESTKKKEDTKSGDSTKEKGEGKSGETTREKGDGKSGEKTREKGDGKSGEPTKEKGDGKSGETTKEKGDGKSGETTKIIEYHGDGIDEIKIKDNVPYIIHYVYAPQLFSDENPNSCSIL